MTASNGSNPTRVITRALLGVLLAASVSEAQQGAVLTGKITNETGQALSQAQVYIAELTISVPTNAQGVYSITIPAARATGQTAQLRVRAIGYAPAAKPIQLNLGSQSHDFTLKRDINRLTEVTVTGSIEGTERAKVPFAIGRVTEAELPVPTLDPLRMLAGKVPGLRVAQTSGQPGSSPEIMLRGPTSINGSGRETGPMIIVDGTIMRIGSLNEIGALDIESVEVVKGAAGASLYGTTAANGVIIIKTKRGGSREGTSWNARTEYGVSDLASLDYGVTKNHHLQLDESGAKFCVAGGTGISPCSRSTDWMTEILRINNVNGDTTRTPQSIQWNAVGGSDLTNTFQSNVWPGQRYDGLVQVATSNPVMMNSLDVSGRAGNVRFFVSGAYTNDEGGIKGLQGQQQRRARVNIDFDIRQDWRLSLSTLYDQGLTDNRSGGSSNGGIFGQLLRGAPPGTNYLARDTLGRPIVRGGGSGLRGSGNGAGTFLYDTEALIDASRSRRFLGAISSTYTPADWVTLESSIAFDNRDRLSESYLRKGYRTFTSSTANNFGNMQASNLFNEAMNASLSATFRRELTADLNGKLSLRALTDRTVSKTNASSGQQFVVEDVYTLSNTTANKTATSSYTTIKNTGFSAGANLDWKGRYILDGTFRYDGSSLFGDGNRWAPFGRISAVWLASEESFWNVPGISEFRVRASRGTAGNTPSFAAQYETFSCGTTGCSTGTAGNRQLKPETTAEFEAGMDFTILDRVGVEVTRANSVTKNQILEVTTAAGLGFGTQWQNAGTLSSRTIELAFNVPVISRADLQWDVKATYDRTISRITELNMAEYFTNAGAGSGNGSFFLITDRTTVNHGFPVNQIGNIWGRRFYRNCGELPATVRTSCGANQPYQVNNQGYVVWVGGNTPAAGDDYTWRDGITSNLWQTKLPQASSPWNYPLYWGMPIVDRPLAGQFNEGVGNLSVLGNSLPDFRVGLNTTLTYKKFSLYALFDGTFGHEINNQAEGWGLFDFTSNVFDQGSGTGTTVQTAKPVGYTWRVGGTEGVGVGGLYDILGPNNYNVEDGSYVKIREMSLSYKVGQLAGVGDWTVSFVGRNLMTFTNYSGGDPEIGISGGPSGNGFVNQIDLSTAFPPLRTFSLSVSTRF